jgi:hypothetical protein
MAKLSLGSLILGGALGAGIALAGAHLARPARPTESAVTVPAGEAADQMRQILKGADPLRRVSDLSGLLPRVDPAAAPELSKVFASSQLDSGEPELVLFGMWWAMHDPKAAMDWAALDWRARTAGVIAAIVRIWAHQDPQAALAAAHALPLPMQRDLATDAAIAGWDESGKPGLLEAMSGFNNIEFQQASEALARRRVIALGPEGALKWADSLQGMPHDILLVRVASTVASDPIGAPLVAEWARPRIGVDKEDRLSSFPRRIGTRWVQHDPERAMAWLASLPEGNDRNDGVAESFRTWLRRDAPAAHAWIQKTEMQPWNEPAYAIFAEVTAWEDPKGAITIARRIQSEILREPATISIGQMWYAKDPSAAKAWFDAQTDLPEHTRRTATMVPHSNPANADRRARFQRGSQEPAGVEP